MFETSASFLYLAQVAPCGFLSVYKYIEISSFLFLFLPAPLREYYLCVNKCHYPVTDGAFGGSLILSYH